MEKSKKKRIIFVAFFITTVHYDSDGISLRPRDTVTIYRIIPGSFCDPIAVLDIKINATIGNPIGIIVIWTEDVPVRRIDGELQRVGEVPQFRFTLRVVMYEETVFDSQFVAPWVMELLTVSGSIPVP